MKDGTGQWVVIYIYGGAIWFNASCLENFKNGLRTFFRRFKLKGKTREELCLTPIKMRSRETPAKD
jgi:hypothetical protein